MAWERKRGKLEQFNRFVLDGDRSGFSLIEGDWEQLRSMKYAIVLDADTELPPGSASRLIGILAHPLNVARYDPETGRLVSGYSILQPRIEILPRSGSGTHFSHFYSGDTAIDIYSRAVSDVYQDLFGTGVFVGKGIYDIAAVERTLANRVPENSILSHDLFEGIHGRAGLVSNVVLYEDFPETYTEYALRLHRWIRGDWQLVPWLRSKVPSAGGGKLRNDLSLLDRWKLIDNLRRSLLSPALLLFFIGAWMVLPGSAIVWTLLALAAPGSYLLGEIYAVVTGGVRANFLSDAVHRLSERGGRWFLSIVFLVSDTLIATDAVLRTLWRVTISKRNLLEWKSAAHTTAAVSNGGERSTAWIFMWPSSAVAALLTIILAIYNTS
ncbi:MAG: cellobiose phosphorylase, partial [Pseudomonadota bacterium]